MVKLFLAAASLMSVSVSAGSVSMESEATLETLGVPLGWQQQGRAPAGQLLEMVFAVKQTNLQQLEATLLDVSDPDSPRYGQHLSNAEVHDLVAPSAACKATVAEFLQGTDAVEASPNGDFVVASLSVADAEQLLEAEYVTLHHAASQTTVTRTKGYSLPAEVAECLDFVAPTVHVPKALTPTKPQTTKDHLRAPLLGNTPKHLRELYSSTGVEGKAADNKMAVTAFLNQKYKLSDLKEFWKLYCDGITCGKGEPKLVGDATTGAFSGVEAMLDIESITGVAGNVEAEFWGFSGHSPDDKENEPFFKWLTVLANTTDADVPKLFSTSYGEDENTWSDASLDRMNVEFQKAGARGISLLYAAGDEGANCESDKFVPETPGSSPYVTAVGGTTGANTEVAVGLSSGGFSNHYAMPAYQTDAVSAYLNSGSSKLPPASRGYNVTGRAYPDIAAQATDFTVVANGIPNPGVAGTSCASPTASGIIALLNDARLQAGQSTLGFLNPFIYKNLKLFNDITSGSSEGCKIDGGWPALEGWDAVTGCGTPNYAQLVKAAVTPSTTVCKKTEYCCPDALKCLTPTSTSCATDDACADGDICCPLTKICVTPGVACTPPPVCKSDEYCCPDALKCLHPTDPGTFCTGKHHCATDEICCPLTKICVTADAPCTPP